MWNTRGPKYFLFPFLGLSVGPDFALNFVCMFGAEKECWMYDLKKYVFLELQFWLYLVVSLNLQYVGRSSCKVS